MLVNGREAMVRRAVRAFQAQTYPRSRLLIYDTGPQPVFGVYPEYHASILYHHMPHAISIGALRNEAIEFAMIGATPAELDIIIHFDSDDWSHPNRIAEQVALLQASGKEAVGYREMLFWKEPGPIEMIDGSGWTVGAAWLYRSSNPRYCLGTSLCTWRRVWEQRPFPDLPKPGMKSSEDALWLMGQDVRDGKVVQVGAPVDALGVDSLHSTADFGLTDEPRMIASYHGGNTSTQIWTGPQSPWVRVPQWDEHCRRTMAL